MAAPPVGQYKPAPNRHQFMLRSNIVRRNSFLISVTSRIVLEERSSTKSASYTYLQRTYIFQKYPFPLLDIAERVNLRKIESRKISTIIMLSSLEPKNIETFTN